MGNNYLNTIIFFTIFAVFTSIFLSFPGVLIGHNIIKPKQDETDTIFEKVDPKKPDEIRQYTLFTTVKFGNSTVSTGTRFNSTSDRDIVRQWCNLIKNTKPSEPMSILTIAAKSKDGTVTKPRLSNSSVLKFGLTLDSAKALVDSHCRFK